MSLAQQISNLSSTVPVLPDSDDDFFTSAQLVDREELTDEDDTGTSARIVKVFTDLAEEDNRYAGKRTSRKTLNNDVRNGINSADHREDEEEDDVLEDEEEDECEEESDISSDSGTRKMIGAFSRSSMSSSLKAPRYSNRPSGRDVEEEESDEASDADSEDDEASHADSDDDEASDADSEDDEASDADSDDDEASDADSDDDDDNKLIIGDIHSATESRTTDIEKGNAVKAQIDLWDSMLEVRMKMRKVQTLVSRLPKPDLQIHNHTLFEDLKNARKFLFALTNQLMFLQTCLLLQHPETKFMISPQTTTNGMRKGDAKSNDDVVSSESEREGADDRLNLTGMKRKMKAAAYPEFLIKRHRDFAPFRNSAIQRWNEKTNLSRGNLTKKSFGAFEHSTLKQIEQILSDKERLIKRTQLNRANLSIIRSNTVVVGGGVGPDNEDENEVVQYSPELFNDDDFYQQLLRELIECKSRLTTDSAALSRHCLEIQKHKTTIKKQVDTKASKGRKIRYDVQAKLVNFMAPNDTTEWSDVQRDELFKSLYGKRFAHVQR